MAITIRNVYDTMSDIALHIQNQGTSFCCPYIQQREIIKSTFARKFSHVAIIKICILFIAELHTKSVRIPYIR